MASDLAAVVAFANEGKKEIGIETPPIGPQFWAARPFRLNSAHSKILALILAYQMPKDFLTGQSIDVTEALSWKNSKEFHHFFPQAFLKLKGVASNNASALANIVYLSSSSNKAISGRAPSEYVKELIDQYGEDARSWLNTNLIDDRAIEAALRDDYDSFLIARSTTIDLEAKKLAGW